MISQWRLLAIGFTLALTACEPSAREMGTLTGPIPEGPPPIAVHDIERHLSVADPAGLVPPADWQKIENFLVDAAAGRPESAHLVIVADATSGAVASVTRHAVNLGYGRDNITTLALRRGDAAFQMRHKLTLTVHSYAAILPNCPQSTHLNLIDGDNMVSSDWGCATVSVYGLEVADPHDLARGRGGAETDAVLTTAAIRRLEMDKVKKLVSPSTTSNAAGAAQ